jgi:hypothetical protein
MAVLDNVFSEGSMAAKDAVEVYFRPLFAVPAQFYRIFTAEIKARKNAEDMREVAIGTDRRFAELKDLAVSEQIFISPQSESDFRSFLKIASATQLPALFLLENGNVRAVWKGAKDEQIGLQFLGGRQVQFVLFSRRYDPEMAVRSCGRDTINGMLDQIGALRLRKLIDEKR